MMNFPTDLPSILQRVKDVDPVTYGKTRNFKHGAVSYLSPYISRGVISTNTVLKHLLEQDYNPWKIEKFIQELAWRDYWQQVWLAKGDAINGDLKQPQESVEHHQISTAVVEANTGILAVDEGIEQLYAHGYMHNHMRMYVAAIACNIGKAHWKAPAQWMYYHLLDADWASNALSWQWVAGSNSRKKYYANQDNINKYWGTKQRSTLVDRDYKEFATLTTPEILIPTETPELRTPLPSFDEPQLDSQLPLLVYNFYNLDPYWRAHEKANRVLLLEPSIFKQYPIASHSLKFMLDLGENIEGLQIFTGEFRELKSLYQGSEIIYKEHPFNSSYTGLADSRDWMFEVQGYFPSFFGFWKQCKKELKRG